MADPSQIVLGMEAFVALILGIVGVAVAVTTFYVKLRSDVSNLQNNNSGTDTTLQNRLTTIENDMREIRQNQARDWQNRITNLSNQLTDREGGHM